MMLIKKNTYEVSPEKIGTICEKGLNGVRLSNKEKKALLDGGLEEIYSLSDSQKVTIEQLNIATITEFLDEFFPVNKLAAGTPVLILKLKEFVSETAGFLEGWTAGSPAFAYRNDEAAQRVSFHKELGRLSIHLEVIRRDMRLADLRVFLSDETGREKASFEVDLLKDGTCIESLNVKPGVTASLCSLELGEYELRLADQKGELSSLRIRME